MFYIESGQSQSPPLPWLHLEDGADAQACGELQISERGMSFCSRWSFEIGTELVVVCVQESPEWGRRRVRLEGLVVWSERRPGGDPKVFETTLLFLEVPEALKAELQNFRFELEGLA